MIKILAWGDYVHYTGFTNVMSNILRRLPVDEFSLDVVGINYGGDPDYDHDRFPGRVWPASTIWRQEDRLGSKLILERLKADDYDILFVVMDTFVLKLYLPEIKKLQAEKKKPFKIVFYFPCDSEPMTDWIRDSVFEVDYPVAYTEFAHSCCMAIDSKKAKKVPVILHGVNTQDFYPIEDHGALKRLRNAMFMGRADDAFLLLNVNRNQPRKDIPRSLMVLKELLDRGENVKLYLHMSNLDAGGSLHPTAQKLGLEFRKDYFMPSGFTPWSGYPFDTLNKIYNISDCLITTSLGEGFGLSLIEAFITKVPVIAPAHSAMREIIGKDRGWLVSAGNNSSLWRTLDADNPVLRPLVDVSHMATRIQRIMGANKAFVSEKTDAAYEWAVAHDWDKIVENHWLPVLRTAAARI